MRAEFEIDRPLGAPTVIDPQIGFHLRRVSERRAVGDHPGDDAVRRHAEIIHPRVGIGEAAVEAKVARRPVERIDLDAASRNVAGVGEAGDEHARHQIGVVRLEVLILRVIAGDVQDQLAIEERVLQPDFISIGRFGRDHIGAGRGQVEEHVIGRPLIAARISEIGGHRARGFILEADPARNIVRRGRGAERHPVRSGAVEHALIEIGLDTRPGERRLPAVEHGERVIGVTGAADQAEIARQVEGRLAEHRRVLEGRAEERRAEGLRHRHPRRGARGERGGRRSQRADQVRTAELALGISARIESADDIVDQLALFGGDAQLLGDGIGALRPEIVQLVQPAANIGLRQEIAVANLGIVPLAVGCDRGERTALQIDIGLERDAPAILERRGDEVLRQRAGAVAQLRRQHGRDLRGIGVGRAHHRRRADHLATAIIGVGMIIGDERERQILDGFGDEDAANAEMLIAVHPAVNGGVADIAVIIGVGAGQSQRQLVADDRQIERAAHTIFGAIVKEIARLAIAAERLARALGDDVDHARRAVLAEQGTLRPAQHFQPIDVDQIVERLARALIDHAVDHRGDRGFAGDRESGSAHAAQEQRLVERRARLPEIERRHQILRVLDIEHARACQLLAAHHRDRDRHVLQPLAALLRGDDDIGRRLVRRVGRGGRRLGCLLRGGGARDQRQQRGAAQQIGLAHPSLPSRPIVLARAWGASLFVPWRLKLLLVPSAQNPSSAIVTTRFSRAESSAATPIATARSPSWAVTSTAPSPRTAAMNF